MKLSELGLKSGAVSFPGALEEELAREKALLARCESLEKAVPGRLALKKDVSSSAADGSRDLQGGLSDQDIAESLYAGGIRSFQSARSSDRNVLIHVYKDALSGRTRSRKLGRRDGLLKKRLKLAALSREMIPLLVYNIKELEKLRERLKDPDIGELEAGLSEAFRDIGTDIGAFRQ